MTARKPGKGTRKRSVKPARRKRVTRTRVAEPEALAGKQASETFPLVSATSVFSFDKTVPRPELVATFNDYARVYGTAVWVFASVGRIAQALAKVKIKVMKVTAKGEEEELDSHPLRDLLTRVNPYQGAFSFKEATQSGMELFGNSYWEKVRPANGGPPTHLYPLSPTRIKAVPDPKKFISSYVYDVNGKKITFDAMDIVHFKTYNPQSEFYGMPTVQPGAISIETDLLAASWNKWFFKNHSIPEGVFLSKKAIKKTDQERVAEEFKKLYRGVKNSHKVGFLSGEWEWINMAIKHRDSEFIKQRKLSREEILAAFMVPPVMVGIFEFANYANSKEQIQIFWKVSMLPRIQRLEDQINETLAPEFGEDIRVRFDVAGIAELKEDENSKVDRTVKQVQSAIITPNEAREAMGLEKSPDKAMDRFYIGGGLTPIDQSGQTPPAGGGDEPPDGGKAKGFDPPEEWRLNRWKQFDEELTRQEISLMEELQLFFRDQEEQVVGRLDKAGVRSPLVLSSNGSTVLKQDIEIEELLFDEMDAEAALAKIGTAHFTESIERAGRQKLAEIGLGGSFRLTDPVILEFIEGKVLKFKEGINEVTREAIRAQLLEAQRLGEAVADMADRIKHVYENATSVRALRIARTELIGTSNYGAYQGMNQTGVVRGKRWLSSRDQLVRATHQHEENITFQKEIGLNTPFSNGLMYPGDQSGPASEVVNCRCTLLEVI